MVVVVGGGGSGLTIDTLTYIPAVPSSDPSVVVMVGEGGVGGGGEGTGREGGGEDEDDVSRASRNSQKSARH